MTTCDCALCCLSAPFDENLLSRAGFLVAYIDDDVIGIVPADRPGVLVAPRRHTPDLFAEPERSAPVLAALRRMVEEVKISYGVAEATVEPITDLPAASGHVCYHVAPVAADDGTDTPFDLPTRARRVADALRRQVFHLWRRTRVCWSRSAVFRARPLDYT